MTVSRNFGWETADRLAALAIDLACDAPEKIETHRTQIRARLVEETREAMETAGIDWRHLVRARIVREREQRAKVRGEER